MGFKCQSCGKTTQKNEKAETVITQVREVVYTGASEPRRGFEPVIEETWCRQCSKVIPEPQVIGDYPKTIETGYTPPTPKFLEGEEEEPEPAPRHNDGRMSFRDNVPSEIREEAKDEDWIWDRATNSYILSDN